VLKFIAFQNGEPVSELDVTSAYMLGPDEVPIKSQVKFVDRLVTCEKNIEEAAALAILWNVKGQGKYLLQTTRLPDRDRPYILNMELARWRLMRIQSKFEDWGLFDYPKTESIMETLMSAKKLFIRALQNEQNPAQAADFADQSLEKAMEAGEALAKFHAMRMFGPRVQAGNLNRKLFGCRINPGLSVDQIAPDILANLNFVTIPLNWADLEPARKKFNLASLDRLFEFFLKRKVTIRLGSVIAFSEPKIPVWLREKPVEFELLRDVMYEYLTAIASRYGKCIRSWAILSGLHADNYFGLSFEQILDLTRLMSSRAKRLCPRASSVIEITAPWGEYYAHNARSIHPYLYSEMVAQSGINFDAFALRLPFGAAREGHYVRDFFQISSLIDRYTLGKPIHLTTTVPSKMSGESGYWDSPWTPDLQAKWFENFCKIALSKSQVESITWDAFGDSYSESVPYGGLLTENWTSKPVFARIREIQKRLDEARASLRQE
jgi:hypothetical protein